MKINHQPVGSGAGRAQIEAYDSGLGASDAPRRTKTRNKKGLRSVYGDRWRSSPWSTSSALLLVDRSSGQVLG